MGKMGSPDKHELESLLMKFNVEIFESNSKVETIEAESKDEAIAMVRNLYEEGKIKLTDENSHVDVDFKIV